MFRNCRRTEETRRFGSTSSRKAIVTLILLRQLFDAAVSRLCSVEKASTEWTRALAFDQESEHRARAGQRPRLGGRARDKRRSDNVGLAVRPAPGSKKLSRHIHRHPENARTYKNE